MKTKLSLIVAGLISMSFSAFGAVTLNFNNAFAGGVTENFADAAGTPSNGLFWGIIVDTDGTGFLSTFDPVTLSAGSQSILTFGGTNTSNVIVFSDDLTTDTSAFFEGDIITNGGVGGITGITDLSIIGNAGITQGDSFAIVWFDPSGNSAGILQDASFVIPADGNASDFDGPFVGDDPVRAAVGITFVPEPSTALLGAIGALGLLRRRR